MRRERRVALRAAFIVAAVVVAGFLWWRPETRLPHVVIITVESLRTDHVRCLGGDHETTPALDALAAQGVIYDDAHSVTSWTLASHASLFTGLYPTAHQTTGPLDRLGLSYDTLAEVLRDRGYQCAGVVSGPYLRRTHQLNQGFEHWDEAPSSPDHPAAHSAVTNEGMQAGLTRFLSEKRDAERPLFLFAYYWDPHYDFIPPTPFDQQFVTADCEPIDMEGFGTNQTIHPGIRAGQLAYVKSQYDGEILCTDGYLGRLFEELKARGLWEDALIIVTADHGEEFFDHGQKGHKNNLYAETCHVPLIIKYPGKSSGGRRDSRLVSHVDILPTVLELTGAAFESPQHGQSLLRDEPRPDRSIHYELLETWYTRVPGQTEVKKTVRQWYAIRQDDLKYIGNNVGLKELYDISADPAEKNDLFRVRQKDAALLHQSIDRWLKDMEMCKQFFEAGGRSQVSPEHLEALRSLGYIRD